MNRCRVIFTADSSYDFYKKGERGYIDGYLYRLNGNPGVVVVKDNGYIVCAPLPAVRVINVTDKDNEHIR